ncbi:dTDP-4-dehydrorhamnose 3,5-epimerase [Pseudozobellia sp. WGM2]|uniref:dTDP-4-dehydrorhamnose 3,5-epimerase n=1 Tax=Pseudozobellia sp. WGM2 TaxID=2787625 RepID=UPI001ADFFDD7|nr:dTDP-4-dehydrorhamnose 3,5-epimerase [Pseudozobellia sp. WGM2]
MEIIPTKIAGCFIIQPRLFHDDRGLFYESYNSERFKDKSGVRTNFVQDNISVSQRGVLRGLHFQIGYAAQSKLVSVLKGEVLDVVVDLRKDSITFGKHIKVRLSESNRKQLFIPKGMAHGFLSLADETIFSYKCDAFYTPSAESGIVYDDPELNIDWEFSKESLIISKKDLKLPTLKKALHDISISDRV